MVSTEYVLLILIFTNISTVVYLVSHLERMVEAPLDCVKLNSHFEHIVLTEKLAVQNQEACHISSKNRDINRLENDSMVINPTLAKSHSPNQVPDKTKPDAERCPTLEENGKSYFTRKIAERSELDPRQRMKEATKRKELFTQLSYASDIITRANERGAESFNINNTDFCQHKSIDLLVWIHSAPADLKQREVIRKTWRGSRDIGLEVKVIFGIGKVDDQKLQEDLESEYETFQDLVQDDAYIDSYLNLTFKTHSMVRWVDNFCPTTKVVMKIDADTFLVVDRFLPRFKESLNEGDFDGEFINCRKWTRDEPITDPDSRWYTPPEIWPEPYFAEYSCYGGGYFISRAAIPLLLKATKWAPFIWLEDVYMTGVVAQAAGIQHVNIWQYYKVHTETSETYSSLEEDTKLFIVAQVEDLPDYVALSMHDFND